MEARVGLGTSATVVELLGTSGCIEVEDGSFVIGVSDGVICGGCGGGGDVRRAKRAVVEADGAGEGI